MNRSSTNLCKRKTTTCIITRRMKNNLLLGTRKSCKNLKIWKNGRWSSMPRFTKWDRFTFTFSSWITQNSQRARSETVLRLLNRANTKTWSSGMVEWMKMRTVLWQVWGILRILQWDRKKLNFTKKRTVRWRVSQNDRTSLYQSCWRHFTSSWLTLAK